MKVNNTSGSSLFSTSSREYLVDKYLSKLFSLWYTSSMARAVPYEKLFFHFLAINTNENSDSTIFRTEYIDKNHYIKERSFRGPNISSEIRHHRV